MQVGYVGLLKAINNFDPEPGTACPRTPHRASAGRSNGTSGTSGGRFTSAARSRNCCSRCARRPGTWPRNSAGPYDGELAAALRVTEDDIREARQASLAFSASSLDAPLSCRGRRAAR